MGLKLIEVVCICNMGRQIKLKRPVLGTVSLSHQKGATVAAAAVSAPVRAGLVAAKEEAPAAEEPAINDDFLDGNEDEDDADLELSATVEESTPETETQEGGSDA